MIEVLKSRRKFKNMKCNYCDKMGHIHKFCYKWKRDDKGGNDKHPNYQNKKDDHDKDDRVATATTNDLVIVYDEDVANSASCESSWVVDSGASRHVTSKKEFFTNYTPGDFGILKKGNGGLT